MVDAIVREIELRKEYLSSSDALETIYFGGGTPSLLNEEQLEKVLNKVYSIFNVSHNPEITLEANPDDLSTDKLKMLNRIGINRLSIGLQSFLDEELQFMNRVHTAKESLACVQHSQDIGITNISIDLIFGIQGSSLSTWESNLQTALSLSVPHMSCYNLTVEPRTALAHMVRTGKVADVDSDLSAQQFKLTMDILQKNHYDHYEISNYAKDGLLSKHNTNYWRSVPYIGIGPSAHSFDGMQRAWNLANNALYLKAMEADQLPITEENLTANDRVNEYLMTGLRTKWGCSAEHLEKICSGSSIRIFDTAEKHITQELLLLETDVLRLTDKGKYFADQIASDLFLV